MSQSFLHIFTLGQVQRKRLNCSELIQFEFFLRKTCAVDLSSPSCLYLVHLSPLFYSTHSPFLPSDRVSAPFCWFPYRTRLLDCSSLSEKRTRAPSKS